MFARSLLFLDGLVVATFDLVALVEVYASFAASGAAEEGRLVLAAGGANNSTLWM